MEIDFLLDEEKKSIESQVLSEFKTDENKTVINDLTEKYTPNEDKKIDPEIKAADPLKKKKADLIDDFMKLQEERGDIKFERKKLDRLTKGVIIKEIANYMNEALIEKKVVESKTEPEIEFKEGELNPHQLELVSHGLFQMNQVLISLLETGSNFAKDKTGGISVLEGWSENSLAKKEQFINVFKLIYKDYKVELDKYLSPIVQYTILMGNTAAEVIVKNVKKKKENCEQN